MKVFKYPIDVANTFTMLLPLGAQILHVDAQNNLPCLWALVDPVNDDPANLERRTFHIVGTGHEVPEGVAHVGTFLLYGGDFVGHLFEERA